MRISAATSSSPIRRGWWLLLLLLSPLLGCAKTGRPSGGPVDRTAPRVVDHYPPADATGIPLDTAIDLVFDEAMERSRTTEAIFITPKLEVRYQWGKGHLRLQPQAPLQANRTYVITLGTGARDLRGNNLEQSFTLAFATGDRLNQGRFSGRLYADHQPVKTAHIWAYALDRFDGRLGHDEPDYRTQSGKDGRYEFTRLSAGSYRLFAFVDQNRNQQWDPGEDHALPAGDLRLDEAVPRSTGDMALQSDGSALPRLQRVQALHVQGALLEFSRAVDAQQLDIAFADLAIEAHHNSSQDSARVYLRTAPQQAGASYPFTRLHLDDQPLEWSEGLRGTDRTDRTAPTLVRTYPAAKGQLAPGDTLQLQFSEFMQVDSLAHFWAASDSTQSPAGTWRWRDGATAQFTAAAPYVPGPYRLQGPAQRLTDLQGLALQKDVELNFTVLDTSELARLEGHLLGLDEAAGAALIIAREKSTQRLHSSRPDTAGAYRFNDLPPGTYTVFGYIDRNSDQTRDPGALDPFRPADPYAVHPEPLDLDAGQRLTEIDLLFQ